MILSQSHMSLRNATTKVDVVQRAIVIFLFFTCDNQKSIGRILVTNRLIFCRVPFVQ